ncbi:MAG: enoyl-CoA hydratase [Thiotrichales bacterium]|nr:enoyl-CoA hydratase [Thiotrichales bacterium]
MTDAVTQDVADNILTLTMNWPDRLNVLGGDMVDGLAAGFKRADEDPDVRGVILQGAGNHFCAGGDIQLMQDWVTADVETRQEQFRMFIERFHVVVNAMQTLSKPVIASVHGAVAGAGLSITMGCDLAIAADDAVFTLAYIKIGTSPDGGGTYCLPRIVGLKKAMEIAMLGDRFDAETALSLGILNKVVAPADREQESRSLALRLAEGPTIALGRTKALLQASLTSDLEGQLKAEKESFAHCAATDDFTEGMMAFMQKRPPEFRGE